MGLESAHLEVFVEKNLLWGFKLRIADRTFSVGAVYRDGFECLETTNGKYVNFLSHRIEPIFGREDRLLAIGLSIVKYAIEHPLFTGVEHPVIE